MSEISTTMLELRRHAMTHRFTITRWRCTAAQAIDLAASLVPSPSIEARYGSAYPALLDGMPVLGAPVEIVDR